jgi:hypothetical protein
VTVKKEEKLSKLSLKIKYFSLVIGPSMEAQKWWVPLYQPIRIKITRSNSI